MPELLTGGSWRHQTAAGPGRTGPGHVPHRRLEAWHRGREVGSKMMVVVVMVVVVMVVVVAAIPRLKGPESRLKAG